MRIARNGLLAMLTIGLIAGKVSAQNDPIHFHAVDLKGNGKDSLVIYDPAEGSDRNALGILDVATYGTGFQTILPWYFTHSVPGRRSVGEWSLNWRGVFVPCNLDGRGSEDLIAYSRERQIGVLYGVDKITVKTGWTNPVAANGIQGYVNGPAGQWLFSTNEAFFPIDTNGDGKHELLAYDRASRLGMLTAGANGIRASWICPTDDMPEGGSRAQLSTGSMSWIFDNTDRFYPLDINGDGKQEVLDWAEDRAMVMAARSDFSLRIAQVTENHDPSARFRGPAGDWHIGQHDEPCIADLDGDGKDEVVVVNAVNGVDGRYAVLKAGGNGRLEVAWRSIDVRGPGGTWTGNDSERFLTFDINGDGREEVLAISPRRIAVLSSADGKALRADWISTSTIEGPAHNPWMLNGTHEFAQGDFDGDGKHEIAVYNRIHHIGILARTAQGGLRTVWNRNIGRPWTWGPTAIQEKSAPFPQYAGTKLQAYRAMSEYLEEGPRAQRPRDIRRQYASARGMDGTPTIHPLLWRNKLNDPQLNNNRPAEIPLADWNGVKAQLQKEFGYLSMVQRSFDDVMSTREVMLRRMKLDANHVEEKMSGIFIESGSASFDAFTLIKHSLSTASLLGGVGKLPETVGQVADLASLIIDIVESVPDAGGQATLLPGQLLQGYRNQLDEDFLKFVDKSNALERAVMSDWGRLSTFATRHLTSAFQEYPIDEVAHRVELYQKVFGSAFTRSIDDSWNGNRVEDDARAHWMWGDPGNVYWLKLRDGIQSYPGDEVAIDLYEDLGVQKQHICVGGNGWVIARE